MTQGQDGSTFVCNAIAGHERFLQGDALGMTPCAVRAASACGAVLCACFVGACGDDPNVLGVVAPAASGAEGGAAPSFILGADISSVQQAAAGGTLFYDDDGTSKDILTLLGAHGFNYVRLRTFVDPTQSAPNPQGGTFAPYSTQGYCDLPHTVAVGKQVKAAGMGLLLDFHYSDTWADPAKQVKPAAWANDDLPTMAAALHDYTQSAVSALVGAGARPDMVQLGNDITPGIELSPGTPLGSTSSFGDLAQLLNAGISAVRSVDPTIQIMLHIDRCADPAGSVSWVSQAMNSGLAFDVLGESCFTVYQGQPSGWPATLQTLVSTFPGLKVIMAQYNADTGDPTEIRQANDMVFGLPEHQGLGTFFWEPTESGAWGPGLFTQTSGGYGTVPASIDQFDQMKAAYGL
jgi:arabinogalactan endo-1,4-beta-galactosidase